MRSRRDLRETLEALRVAAFEKSQFDESVIIAHARLLFTPWLDHVVRKSHHSETEFYRTLWDQEPQYFILFQENGRVCEVPIFLTELEEEELEADFQSAIAFANRVKPTLEEVEAYTSVVGTIFKEAIKYDEVRYCKPVKFYTFAGFVIAPEDKEKLEAKGAL